MRQYAQFKQKHEGAILLFRVGDFYETFGEDAVKASQILGITLTKRSNGSASEVQLAGFPYHSLDTYLPKLVQAGQRVAICEQLEKPSESQDKIVKRGITELVTPGVSLNDKILNHKTNNYLAALHISEKDGTMGMAFCDVTTGEFLVAEGDQNYTEKLLQSFAPAEVLFERSKKKIFEQNFGTGFYSNYIDDWAFAPDYTTDLLTKHFETLTLKGFGIDKLPQATIAAGIIVHYLQETNHPHLRHINHIARIDATQYMWLDRFTIRNLELIDANHGGVPLINIIDHTTTPMGARLLRKWLVFPLKNAKQINERQNVVSFLVNDTQNTTTTPLKTALKQIGDLERLVSKIATARITPREALHLKNALCLMPSIKLLLEATRLPELITIAEKINICTTITQRLSTELCAEPAAAIGKGDVIADGVSDTLDDLRKVLGSGKDYLSDLQRREAEKTGISSLKIHFNNVFGYYLEVTNTHKDRVPPDWIRKQTLVNAERYITPELKKYEDKILGAEDKILTLEAQIYGDLVHDLANYIQPIQLNATQVAKLDCLLCFAHTALQNGYTRPTLTDQNELQLIQVRHPVIEKQLPIGEQYIPNDIVLNSETQQIIMITGPNMAGKSAILRQTALCVILAQIGSYVPAQQATIGITDKIFTRVGATDSLSTGESTFMVEMNETASILNNISDRSLILLDEIGRGTATYDGVSIAWAIAEYLHQHPNYRPKTLFATHYHELNMMTEQFDRIKNYNVAVKELDGKIIFLRKLVAGGSEHSFGIYVAKLAGVPQAVLQRATEVLQDLEKNQARKTPEIALRTRNQTQLFQVNDALSEAVKQKLKSIDINTITPVEALFHLHEIKKLVKG
jgi:DNA mismatch repair protein MutS